MKSVHGGRGSNSTKRAMVLESQYVPLLVGYCHARGVDLAGAVGAPLGPARKLTFHLIHRAGEAAAKALGEPDISFRLACAPPAGFWGAQALAARAAPTVKAGMERVVRFCQQVAPFQIMTWQVREQEGTCDWWVPDAGDAPMKYLNEFVAGVLVRAARELAGERVSPSRVWFSHDRADADVAAYQAYFGSAKVAFGAARNGFALDRSLVELEVPTADAFLLEMLDGCAIAQIPDKRDDDIIVAEVARAVAAQLDEGEPSIERTAKRLGIGARTLQRRLRERGWSFRDVAERMRQELAMKYVADVRLSLLDVAVGLGYSDSRSFSRAFRRWTGKTPAEHRRVIEDGP